MSGGHEPIEVTPRRVRPPYDSPDPRFEHLRATDEAAWRVAVRLDRVAALREPLAGMAVTDLEHRMLEWLAGWDIGTVAVVVGLLHRARAAEPLLDRSSVGVRPSVAVCRPLPVGAPGTSGNGWLHGARAPCCG